MTCPICDRESTDRYRPFCSRRCADVDLGRWMTGAYRVPSEELEDVDDPAEAAEKAPEKPH
ncbi:DNA gyrase inhibitor YacG [Rhodobacterales bacterium HKCCE2091]|nr:DNA gyrase inhibitor YacG [Rhodobacterales bacterium HKCCE2091]